MEKILWIYLCFILIKIMTIIIFIQRNYELNNGTMVQSNTGTGNESVYHFIEKTFKYGYLHHNERLMVMANYMILSNIDPNDMYQWFMVFSLDSYIGFFYAI